MVFESRRSLDELRALLGAEIGVSRWIEVTQEMIDRFAEVTDDHQFIHVNPELAAKSPFGGTIAHGFLTLSLLSTMVYESGPSLKGVAMGVNYGFDKIRFLSPVRAGKRIRGRFTLLKLDESVPGQVTYTQAVTVEIEGEEKPALFAEWIGRVYMEKA
ncbi:MaoC family dehydratase [Pikeienuella sp. HZG-20]|uniref:MaoC family dehydratase n=1 Tax=Paludibacillus litoralis TaxID=3133267 RepID=UPI0030EC81EA